MWFKRTARNRRHGREFVLDVRLRSSQVRAQRARMVAVFLGGFFLVVAAIYLGWRATEAALNLLLYENKAFAVQDIDVQTDGVIASEQLRQWTGVRTGQNLFALDLDSIRRNLLLVSMIQSASVEKVLPHTLRVRVVEREPAAQISIPRPKAGGGIEFVPLYIDEEGYVIQPLAPVQCSVGASLAANDQLPTIGGVIASEVQPGRQVNSPQVRAALELVLAYERSSMPGLSDISRIDVSSPDVLTVKTSQGSEITFGLADFDQQFLRWQSIFEKAQSMNKAIATLDLAVSNSIPLTWLEGSTVPPISIKAVKPLRNRKKHV